MGLAPYVGLADTANRKSLATTTFLSGFKQHRSNQVAQNVYADTLAGAQVETWTNTNAWLPTTAATVTGGAAFAPSTSNTQPMTRTGVTVNANETARFEGLINIVAGSTKNIFAGFSTDTSGTTPAASTANVALAIGASGSNIALVSLGTTQTMLLPGPAAAGLYKFVVEVGPLFLSVSMTLATGLNAISCWWAPSNTGTLFVVSRTAAALLNKPLIPWVLLGDTAASGSSFQQLTIKKGPASSPVSVGITPAANTFVVSQLPLTGLNAGHSGSVMVVAPQGYDSRRPYPAVLCFHSSGGLLDDYLTSAQKQPITKALLAAGYILILATSQSGYTTWGNQNQLDTYTLAAAYARDNFNIGPICYLGTSMGGIESLLSLAEMRVPDVVAWAGISPTYSQYNCYVNGVGGGFPPLQTAAFGATFDALLAATAVGATSIKTTQSYTAGMGLIVDANLNSGAIGEFVTVTANSTGSAAPFTTSITPLKTTHATGALVTNLPYMITGNNALSSAAPDGLPIHDPASLPPTSFRGVPMYLFTAPDDTLVQPAGNGLALLQSVQAVAQELLQYPVPSGTGGHTFTLTADMANAIVRFFNKYTGVG